MTNYLSRQILFLLIFVSFSFNQDCAILNPNNYGDCNIQLGYVWNGEYCLSVHGCDIGNDVDSFYETFEECDLQCSDYASLGDVNNDGNINVIDVVAMVNSVLENFEYTEYSDLNFDGLINVIDIVALVNLIVNFEDETRSTWQIINEDILTPKCANCHYPGSFFSETSNLILTQDVAYEQLINKIPDNNSAQENNLVLLSNESGMLGLLKSLLWEKININNESHFYSEHPQYGEIMPLGGPFLKNGELDFIEDWIWAGAPEEGVVADPIILNDQTEYTAPEFTPLDPPILGFQYHIGPFDVLPNTEREFLYYVPSESNDYYVNRVEITMAPGSHHFIAYKFSDDYNDPLPENYTYRDIHNPYINDSPLNPEWVENIITLQEHIFIFGTQWPSWDYSFPEGVALKIATDFGLDLNPHYFNYTDEIIEGEVYLNLHATLPPDVIHEAGILQLGENNILLPPNQITTLEEVFTTNAILNGINIDPPNSNSQLKIFQLFSHAHQLMTRFDILILNQNGQEELIYTALDYEHPPILELDPPLSLQQGQSIISRVTYNNTTDNYVNFGLLSTDEMMIVFGLIYFD